jgi:hypothetical protein
MNDERWRAFCLHLEEGWKGEMTEQRRAVYATFLKGVEFDDAMAALRKLAQDGSPWLPTVPELVAAIMEITAPPVPAWTEVWGQIEECMRLRAYTPRTHTVVVEFVRREGVDRLAMTPFYDPEKGEMRIHQLRTRWLEFVDAQQAHERAQIARASSGLPPLEAERMRELEASVDAS